MGVFLSDDLFTTFVFFEIMSLASYVCVIHDEKKETMYAGAVYLAVAVIGGMVTLMGLLMLYHAAGTLQLDALLSVCEEIFPENARWLYIAGGCILFRIWRQSGYVSASYMAADGASGGTGAGISALLSGVLTKTGVYRCDRHSACTPLLWTTDTGAWSSLLLGVLTMMLGGALLAVFSTGSEADTWPAHPMSQLGFILVGIGMHGTSG